jgi:hypothetical protein
MALMDFSLGLVATGLSSQWTLGLSVVLGGMATALLSKQLQQVCDMKDPFVRHLIALGYCLASYAALSLVIPESVAQVPAFSSGLYLLLGGNLFLLTSLMKNRND